MGKKKLHLQISRTFSLSYFFIAVDPELPLFVTDSDPAFQEVPNPVICQNIYFKLKKPVPIYFRTNLYTV